MNIGKKKKSLCRRKAVPLHFQKKNHVSLSQMLTTASYQRRIRELLKNNKALAIALQDSQCAISSNNGMLRNYEKDINQILLAKVKLKDMAETIQKLVGDLNNVLTHLDACSLSVRRPYGDEARLRIRQPDLDTIDESIRSSVGQNSDIASASTIDCLQHQAKSIPLNISADSVLGNSSVTEIYDVHQVISDNFNTEALDSPKTTEENLDATALEIKTPPTPQLNFSCLNASKLALKEICQLSKHFDSKNDTKLPSLKNTNKPVSRIPLRMQNLLSEKPNFLDSSPDFNTEKRKTFVVTKINDTEQNIYLSENDRRGTFTLNEIHDTMSVTKESNINRRETFVVPSLPLHLNSLKPDTRLLQNSASQPSQISNDDKTVLLSEDMDLTEIIPSCITNLQLNKDTIKPSLNVCASSIRNETQHTADISKVTINAYKPISPISKIKISPSNLNIDVEKSEDSVKDYPKLMMSEIPTENVVQFEDSHVFSKQIECSSAKKSISSDLSSRPSRRKSLHPVILEPKNQSPKIYEIQTSASKIADSTNTVVHINDITSSTQALEKAETEYEINSDPNVLPSKPISPTKSDSEINNFSSDPVSSDPDFLAEMAISSPPIRIPRHKKSIRPKFRGPYIFKHTKRSVSDECEIEKSQCKNAEIKFYDFSSSESEEESVTKSAVNKKKGRKTTKTSKKDNNSIAVLERDINLMYQDQSRKKRSMKRRVSFANINASPNNSDSEKHNENMEVKLALDIDTNLNSAKDSIATGDNHGKEVKRRSILKNRLSIMPLVNPQSSCNDKNISPLKDTKEIKSLDCEAFPKNKVKSSGDNFKKVSKKSTKILDEIVITDHDLSSENKSETNSKKFNLKFNKEKSIIKEKHGDPKCNEIKEEISLPSKLANDKFENLHKKSVNICEVEALTLKANSLSRTPKLGELSNIFLEEIKESTKTMIGELENSDDQTKSKTLSFERKQTSSDIFSFKDKNSKGSKSKRTFSGVSERSSKKRITSTDILEEIDVNGSTKSVDSKLKNNISETKNTENRKSSKEINSNKEFIDTKHFGSELAENCLPKTKNSENLKLTKDIVNDNSNAKSVSPLDKIDNLNKSIDQELPSNAFDTKTKNKKSKQKSHSLTKHKKQSVNLEKKDEQQLCDAFDKGIPSTRPSKTGKTNSTDRTTSEKENFPDLESGGRTRRARTQINFKEPSLNKKLRR